MQRCPAPTPATTGIVARDALDRRLPGALLVDTARAGLVDRLAIAEALSCGTLGGSAADAWSPDPPVPGDDLLHDDRVLVASHVAAFTDVTYRQICLAPAEAVVAVLDGATPDPSNVAVPRRRADTERVARPRSER